MRNRSFRHARPWLLVLLCSPSEAYYLGVAATRQHGRTAAVARASALRAALDAVQPSGGPRPVELDEDGEVIPRKFELCHMDANGEIDECVVVYEDDLEELVGATHAQAMLSDPVAQVFFSSQFDSNSELPEGLQGTVATAPDGQRYLTISDWQVRQCMEADECELPDDIILRGALDETREAGPAGRKSGKAAHCALL
jgi:hypothetical protein